MSRSNQIQIRVPVMVSVAPMVNPKPEVAHEVVVRGRAYNRRDRRRLAAFARMNPNFMSKNKLKEAALLGMRIQAAGGRVL